jgi:hypothetical protein
MTLERRLLQAAILVGGIVPVGAGLAGALTGTAMMGSAVMGGGLSASGDSHWRYLSGLLLAIGLAFWSTIPTIERQTARVRLLTAIVFVGGLCRVASFHLTPAPAPDMLFAATMEVVITPLIGLWQWRVASRFTQDGRTPA